MTTARGDQAQLLVRNQAAFGVAEAAAAGKFFALPFYSYNLTPSEDLGQDDAIAGDNNPGDAVAGLRNMSGDMAVPMGLNSIGWHLSQMMGSPVTSVISAGTEFEHVFETSALPALALLTHGISHRGVDRHFTQDSIAYTSMAIRAQKNGERARATFNLMGREEASGVPTLDATPVSYAPDYAPVGFQGLCSIDGGAAASITAANYNLTRGIEPDQESLNGLATAAAIDDGVWGLEGSVDIRFKDMQIYDLANAGTAFKLELKWTISASAFLTIEAPSIRLERSGVPIGGRGNLSASFNFKGNRPAAGQPLLRATLRNATANYDNLA
ncbi:phage tail tube protein [Pseudophaeobacter sp.]|uniref:phage tail tube protein n=1 Tax=Pseudophaeobacter sp. TaxID=1971739 RepID=UPI00326594F5